MLNAQLKVLIAEDDRFSQKVLAEMLKDSNVSNVDFADSGDVVLAKIDSHADPDLLICDLHMPGVDGIDLLRMLGERDFKGEIIVISGCDKRIIKAACKMAVHYKLNLTGGLEKPIDSRKLARLIRYCGENKKALQANNDQLVFTEEEIEQAISQAHIVPYFQPQVDVETGEVFCVECLARWQHPGRGLLLPGDFLPQLKAFNLLESFNEMLFVAALKEFKHLHSDCNIPHMAFNLPPECLNNPELAARYQHHVTSVGLKTEDIIIEVLESHYEETQELPVAVLNHLRLKGFGLSVDDFGTGYSSLDRVSKVPVTGVKVDKRFVLEAHDDEVARSIIRNTVHLANELNLKTVAEGIENMDDWVLMRELGCNYIQGYLVARPKIASQFKIWLESWKKVMKKSGLLAG